MFSTLVVDHRGHVTTSCAVACGTIGRTVRLRDCRNCTSFVDVVADPLVGTDQIRCDDTTGPESADPYDAPITNVLSAHTTCLAADAGFDVAKVLLVDRELGDVVVVVDAAVRPIGVLRSVDLARHPTAASVGEIMSRLVTSVPDWASVRAATIAMADARVDLVSVVDHDGRLIGVARALDLVAWLAGPSRRDEP